MTKENARTISYSLMQLVRPDTAVGSGSPFAPGPPPTAPQSVQQPPGSESGGINLQAVVEVLTSRLADTQSVPTKVAILKWFRHLEEQLPEAVSTRGAGELMGVAGGASTGAGSGLAVLELIGLCEWRDRVGGDET